MGDMEDEAIDFEGEDEAEFEGDDEETESAPRQRSDKAMTFRAQATKNIGRARKSLGGEGADPAMAAYLMQSATVWAILDLAEAVRESNKQL
jgi:hypothetical protein